MTSWNEIRRAATAFAKRWAKAFDEKSQAQSFLKEFFEIFGVNWSDCTVAPAMKYID